MRNSAAYAFCLAVAVPVAAHGEVADCAALAQTLDSVEGYSLTAPPAGQTDGWCVLDGATLRAKGDGPNISVETFRLRGEETDGQTLRIEIDLKGLRISPKAGDRTMDDRLRALFRLQTADLHLVAQRNEAADTLELRDGVVTLSGGTELIFGADIRGADLTAASLLGGSLTAVDLTWRNDGRLLRPAMEAAGEGLTNGETGSRAVDAARNALDGLAKAMPASAFAGESQAELAAMIAALPQGRGRLVLSLVSEDGIGAARVALAALSDDPFGASTLARLFTDTSLTIDWQPGLSE